MCTARVVIGAGADGIERMAARLNGPAFAPHRHDTYAVGVTLAGVQSFRYRGATRHCLAGECHILHPDELHDGRAGTAAGFSYRILYLSPALIRAALGADRPLPFVPDPVSADRRLVGLVAAALRDLQAPTDPLAATELVARLADLLDALSPGPRGRTAALALDGLTRVRERLADAAGEVPSMAALERLAGLDRWTLARQFRLAFGTNPSRYRTQRRLERARQSIAAGAALADAAAAAGFADQSHLTRQFKQAYGLTPGGWRSALSETPAMRRRNESFSR